MILNLGFDIQKILAVNYYHGQEIYMKKADYEKELDRVFSVWVRKSNADEHGMVQCATCINRRHWTQIQNGHYRKRRHMATRWLPKNCAPQCDNCNVNLQGNDKEFEKYLEATYGSGTVDELIFLSNERKSFTTEEIKEKIEHYKSLL